MLLETSELTLRSTQTGVMGHKLPVSSVTDVVVAGDRLTFRVGVDNLQDQVELHLSASLAHKWKTAIETPPPTLAAKLGISRDIAILVIGELESEELATAIAEGKRDTSKHPDLIVACAHTEAELDSALRQATAYAANPPIWVVYRKGAQSDLPEAAVRGTLRSLGFIDTKVASVSATYTALRFIRRT